MSIKIFNISNLWIVLVSLLTNLQAQTSELEDWLAISPSNRPALSSLAFSKNALSLTEFENVRRLLHDDAQTQLLDEYSTQWENRMLEYNQYSMLFFYNVFGVAPADGRSLFISLHGGGGVASSQNDQQYANQQRLYDATLASMEGVYLAPRAPTDTWNLWHRDEIDEFLNIIIQLAVAKENVNPNKVYLLGYSAGGDGVYQLAPRMADRWGAASMMAGHPNDASPLNLRNTPFGIYMGANDTDFNRSGKATEWGYSLNDLQISDPEGYTHEVQIYPNVGHWMDLRESTALPWMANFERNPVPTRVVWKQDDRKQESFYWLSVPSSELITGGEVLAEYNNTLNEVNILENYSDTLFIHLNDDMLDLDEDVVVKYQSNVLYEGKVSRSILNSYQSLEYKGDPNLVFPARIKIIDNERVEVDNTILSLAESSYEARDIKIYPNPATQKAIIDINAHEPVSVYLLNAHGDILKNASIKNGLCELDLERLESEIYYLRIEFEDAVEVKKLLKL